MHEFAWLLLVLLRRGVLLNYGQFLVVVLAAVVVHLQQSRFAQIGVGADWGLLHDGFTVEVIRRALELIRSEYLVHLRLVLLC